MGKKSRRERTGPRGEDRWSKPFKPTPERGERYAWVGIPDAHPPTVDDEHHDAAWSEAMKTFSTTDRIIAKFAKQQHTQERQLHRVCVPMHRIVAITFCGGSAAYPTARHVDGTSSAPALRAKNEGGFLRHKNGDAADNQANNLEWVSLQAAMDHFDDWVTDWDITLTATERALVADPVWRAGLRFDRS